MPYNPQENNQQEQLSKYNEAGAQLYRVGNLWSSCHHYRKKGNLIQWNINLDCVWLELSSDASEETEGKIASFNGLLIEHKRDRNKVYQILMKKETFLRKLQNKQGKGSAYADPDRDDM